MRAISTGVYAGSMTILKISNSFEFDQRNSGRVAKVGKDFPVIVSAAVGCCGCGQAIFLDIRVSV